MRGLPRAGGRASGYEWMMDAILTMHSIDDSGSVISISADSLARLLEALFEAGVEFTSIGRMCAEPAGGRDRVALTFDDGLRSVHAAGLPLLERLGVRATIYVVTGWVGRDNGWPGQSHVAPRFPLMDWSELEELRDAGFEIGSHTCNHPRLDALDPDTQRRELYESKHQLEERLQIDVRHMAYPYGSFDNACTALVGASYETAVTTRMGYRAPGTDPLQLPRIDSFYLRASRSRSPLFGLASRTRLGARKLLRRVRRLGKHA